MNYLKELGPYLWVLFGIASVLFFLVRFAERTNRLVDAMVDGLVNTAKKNALAVLLAVILAVSASIGAFIDNFGPLDRAAMEGMAWWQIAAVLAKCANPGLIAIIGFLMKSPLASSASSNQTTPQ